MNISSYSLALASLRSKPAHELKEVGDQWCTPDLLFWGINAIFGPLVLDLFADDDNAKCPVWYTAEDNALMQDWSERLEELGGAAFGNPPYSRSQYHEKQAITGMTHIMDHTMEMREKGGRYVFLIKAATSETWWPEVSAVLYGKYTMTGDKFDPVEVDMGRSAVNNIIQAGGAAWSGKDKETYDPTEDIEAYALNASGVVNIIVFDPKGWALFRSFKAVREKLDTRRGSNSELETALKDLGKAVSYKGMYGDVAIVVYAGQYIEGDTKKNYLPDLSMVLGNTLARGLRTYGAIQDVDALNAGINSSTRYPKNWIQTGDPAREFTMVQSAPLMLLADPDEFVSVKLA